MTLARLLLAAAILLATDLPLRAQEVRLEGTGGSRAARLAREILEAGNYVYLARDTVLPESFRATGDLVIVDSDVRLEGTVEGRVAVLGGVLFVRPGARIAGPIANVGGEVYPSANATVGEIVETAPELRVGVEFDTAGPRVRIAAPDDGPQLVLPRVLGLRLPSYDRVNGLTLAAGPAFLLTGNPEGARVDAWVSYHTAREDFGGGIAARTPLGTATLLEARAERAVFTNEAWVRGDLLNSLSSLFLGNDYRDYWESDRVSLTLGRVHEEALIPGEYAFEPRITLQAMRDRPLGVRDPWSLLGGLDRPNLPAVETEWASAVAGTGFRWQGNTATFEGDLSVEQAIPAVGDLELDFTRWAVEGEWVMQAMWRHTLGVRFRGRGAFADDPIPTQRWTFLGGSPTLPTLEVAELRGNRLAFVESAYGIPLPPRWALPVLGPPIFRLRHAAGTAWRSGGSMPEWEQNLGAGLVFSVARAEVFIDPAADDLDPTLSFGLVFPSF